jgi:hypothetical protein
VNTKPKQVVPIVTLPLTWSSALGLFMLNFGTLEMLVFAYAEKCLPGELETWRRLPLMDRLNRIGQHLTTEPARHAAFQSFQERFRPFRVLRNHLAHGYLQMVVAEGKEPVLTITQATDLDAPLSSETSPVNFEQLTRALSALDELTTEFRRITDDKVGWVEDK